MVEHELKIWPKYFSAVADGRKKFELRKNDREFIVGDILILTEYIPGNEVYTGRSIRAKVTYLYEDSIGLKDGYVIMSIEVLEVR